VSDWTLNGVPTGSAPPGPWCNAKFVLELEPGYGNKKKGGRFEVSADLEYVRALRDLCDTILKEVDAEEAIKRELDAYKAQLADERQAMIDKKRSKLRAKHGFPSDEKDEGAAERERQEALDVLKAMGTQSDRTLDDE
jgi:hypothetical protein